MRLNIPILDQIAGSEHILIAGMGGGYDIFSGLPLFFELEALGYDVHLANFSFSDIAGLSDGEQLTDTLVGVSIDVEGDFDYFPEYYLAEWFFNTRNEFVTIWCFEKTGARPLIRNYRALVDHLEIDCIILVDGGVDSLMHGDEPNMGTLFEDTLSLLAVSELNHVSTRIVACLGLGVEYEVGYPHLFENIAQLVKSDGFFGACSLTKQMEAYQQYEEAVLYVFDQQPKHPSVICASVISATRGEYGDYHLVKRTQGNELHISPLMSLFWFFDMMTIAKANKLLPAMALTYSVDDAWRQMQKKRDQLTPRLVAQPPLP